MKTIQIAPYKKDCKIEDNKVIGTMNGRTFVFELPKNVRMPKDEPTRQAMINNFCEAIALCSKRWQIEDCLNRHWQIIGGKFYEEWEPTEEEIDKSVKEMYTGAFGE